MNMVKTSDSPNGLLSLDPRTILILLVFGNIAVFMVPHMLGELLLMGYVLILALLTGVYRFSVKLMTAFVVLLGLDYLMMTYVDGTFGQTVALGSRFMRKIFPCAMLGGILVFSIQVSEFMAALGRMRVPKAILIPLTIMLRYLPAVGEDRRRIKKALMMRDISPGFGGFIKHPVRTIECIYVPLLMSGSRRAEELSSAAITRGIENPQPRTSYHDVRMRGMDFVCIAVTACVTGGLLRI